MELDKDSEASIFLDKCDKATDAFIEAISFSVDDLQDMDVPTVIENSTKQLLLLKASQTSACLLLDEKIKHANGERSKIDSGARQLQNLQYERDHLTSQIEQYEAYDGDDDLDKFFDSEDYRNPDNHTKNMKDLYFEIKERKKLALELDSAKLELEKMKKANDGKEKFLSDLLNNLQNIEKSSFPVQNYFHNLDNSKRTDTSTSPNKKKKDTTEKGAVSAQRERFRKAMELPSPLYTLCCQLEALCNNKIEEEEEEIEGISNICMNVEISPSIPYTGNEAENNGLFETYSSAILLSFESINKSSRSNSLAVDTIRFQYLPKLDILTAEAEIGSSFSKKVHEPSLSNLFPGDTGVETPNRSNYQLQSFASLPSDMRGRPFQWTQWLGGLNYLPPSGKVGLIEPCSAKIVSLLKQRLYNYNIIHNLILSLGKNPDTVSVHPELDTSIFPCSTKKRGSSVLRLGSWKKLDPDSPNMFELEIPSYENKTAVPLSQRSYYSALLKTGKRKDAVETTLKVFVEISPDYPVEAPRWLIYPLKDDPEKKEKSLNNTIKVDNNLKAIETRVNVDYMSELVNTEKIMETLPYVLNHQLRMIIACWEVTISSNVINSTSTASSVSNTEYNTRQKRGRDRRNAKAFDDSKRTKR